MNQALRKWEENNASIISYHVAEGEGKGGGGEYTEINARESKALYSKPP